MCGKLNVHCVGLDKRGNPLKVYKEKSNYVSLTILWKVFKCRHFSLYLLMALNGSRGKYKNNQHAFSVSACKILMRQQFKSYEEDSCSLYSQKKGEHGRKCEIAYTHWGLFYVFLYTCSFCNCGLSSPKSALTVQAIT